MRADRLTSFLTTGLVILGACAVVISGAVIPVFAVLLIGLAVAGWLMDRSEHYPLSSWALNVLTVAGLLVALALPSPTGPIGRLLAGAIVLMGGKLLAAKSSRDQLQLLLLSLVLLIGAAIVMADVTFALLFFLFLASALAMLTWLPFATRLGRDVVPRPLLRGLVIVGVAFFVGSIPLTAGIFAALPRGTQPLARGMGPAMGQSGFSDRVTLGDVIRIAQSNETAFRAEILDHTGPLEEPPYWRGLVFEDTDSVTWTRVPWPRPGGALRVEGTVVRQRITLEPTGRTLLLALDRPREYLRGRSDTTLLSERVLETGRPVEQRIRYEVASDDSLWSTEPLSADERTRTLVLPPSTPASLIRLTDQLIAGEPDPLRRAELLLDHFRTGGYQYSLAGPGGTDHPLAALLRSKRGYCEHFAAALVLMLREAGIPARMVGGYLGGEYNGDGGYYLVRQRSAHVWAEAYIDGRGWLRMDPTPPGSGPASPAFAGTPSQFSLFLDTLRMRWYSAVIGYDVDRQLALLQSLGRALAGAASWRPGLEAAWAIAGLLAVVAGFAVRRSLRGRHRRDPVALLHQDLLRRLTRQGVQRSPSEGPQAFATRAAGLLPGEATLIRDVTGAYIAFRYADQTVPDGELRDLRRRVRLRYRSG
jgi:transglutaminase-like putative cysteine protease